MATHTRLMALMTVASLAHQWLLQERKTLMITSKWSSMTLLVMLPAPACPLCQESKH